MIKCALYFFKFFSAMSMCMSGMAAAACPPPGMQISNNPAGLSIVSVQVGMDDAGTAIAVWDNQNFNDSSQSISSSFLTKGGTWSSPVTIQNIPFSNFTTNNSQIAVSKSSGNAVAIWEQSNADDPSFLGVYASIFTANTQTWTAAVRVDVGVSVSNSRFPKIAINTVGPNDDYVVAIWQSNNGSNVTLQSSKLHVLGFTPGTWSSPVDEVVPGATESLINQDIVVDTTGVAYAIWGTNSSFTIQTATLPLDGSVWSVPTTFIPAVGESYLTPKIALGDTGFVAASWINRNAALTNYNVKASIYQSGSWDLTPDTISNSTTLAAGISISADLDNNVAVIWRELSVPNATIKSSYRPFMTGLWSATPLQVSTISPSLNPDIVLISGQAHAVWFYRSGTFFEITYASSNNGAPWSTPCAGISDPTVNSNTASLVGDPTQYGVIVYISQFLFTTAEATTFFTPLPPTVTSVSPISGSLNGQNSVLITGTNFYDVQSVVFGPENFSPSFIVVSSTQILAVAPSGSLAPPSVNVIVTTGIGESPANPDDLYSFIDPICWQR